MHPVRKVSNHGKNIIGHFPSLKMKRMIHFESLIERDLIYLLDYDPFVEQFYEQPLTIEYQYEDKRRKYTPDFHVIYAGQNLLLECKPARFVDDPDNQVKFEAARKWCHQRQWTFKVVTDEQLSANCCVENVKLLTRFARYDIPTEIKGRIFACLSSAKSSVRASDIMQAVGPDAPQTVLIPILHMAFHHQVYIPLDEARIDPSSPVSLLGIRTEKGLLPT